MEFQCDLVSEKMFLNESLFETVLMLEMMLVSASVISRCSELL
jgi:hypothetical protein